MNIAKNLKKFNPNQLKILNNSVSMAEELTSNFYKMSASQWLRPKYDIKTLAQLAPSEIVFGPFAQIIRYKGQRKNTRKTDQVVDIHAVPILPLSMRFNIQEPQLFAVIFDP